VYITPAELELKTGRRRLDVPYGRMLPRKSARIDAAEARRVARGRAEDLISGRSCVRFAERPDWREMAACPSLLVQVLGPIKSPQLPF